MLSASGARTESTLVKSTLPPALFISVAIEADKLVNEPEIEVGVILEPFKSRLST